ncbi:arylesterase [Lentiprolixibacter aurantiacus]|uniref:Arylesterase n=1 Tax=Lentiprolixibacter aurantiacus TaxID=2993939 RepID=A0AAE3SNZ2_9FLAO|nr:arylesterase [Lentiprolixibacter aurantiacus]MCX2720060.1 arylesterase [Lentiprolixibacter aurantiacus]
MKSVWKVLKFSYFLWLLFVLGCGDSTSKDKTPPAEAETSVDEPSDSTAEKGTILCFGDSLTAGMGLDPDDAYPAVLQQIIDSLSLNYSVVNAGLSGETTASGRNRLNWVLNQKTDVFILELGANDGLRGINLSETRKNLQEIINMVRKKNPDSRIILAGMQIPPNMGSVYTSEFQGIFPDLAKENDAHLIPFLLKDVGGVPELNQADGIHPTKEGHKILARNVWEVLGPVLLSSDNQ